MFVGVTFKVPPFLNLIRIFLPISKTMGSSKQLIEDVKMKVTDDLKAREDEQLRRTGEVKVRSGRPPRFT